MSSGSSSTSVSVTSTDNIMTSRVVPSQADLNIDGSSLLEVDKDENGWAQTYSCPQIVANNYVTPIALTYYYDLIFLSNENATKSRQYFESLLITTLAEEFGLGDGSACIAPSDDYVLYPVMLSSLPEDEPNESLDNCFFLQPDSTQGCISYTGTLTGYVAGVDDTTELLDYMVSAISKGTVTTGTTLKVSFLGTQIQKEEGRDALTAAVNAEQQQNQAQSQGQTFTAVGASLTAALSLAFVGLIFVIWRMRRRRQQQWREEVVMATRSHEMAIMGRSNNELPHNYGVEGAVDGDDVVSVNDFPDSQEKHSIDIGDNMKSNLFGIHGGASPRRMMTRSAPPSEASEDDSWAQTEATLASLNVRSSKVNVDETGEI